MTIDDQKAQQLAGLFAELPQVVTVAVGGSRASGAADTHSDIDLYVYTDAEITNAEQAALIERSGGASQVELGLPYWGGVNMWIDRATGITIDTVYFGADWMQEQVERALRDHQPNMGYSTCFCRTVQQSQVLYDPRGWLAALQAQTHQPYPEALRRAIIEHNHPVLRTIMSSYLHQIESAVSREDSVSINHRVAALLASYFDIVFALNRVLHPGEKRLLAFARNECPLLPEHMQADIEAMLLASVAAPAELPAHLVRLLDRLDALLVAQGFSIG